MTIAINPILQTNALGSFVGESDGLVVGTAYPDPSYRNWLSGGILDATETLPMWGGIAISELIPTATPAPQPRFELGGRIKRATTYSGTAAGSLTGFSVYDQNYALVNSPQSPVPSGSNGMLVNFYRLGSNARVALEIDPALVSAEGGLISQQFSWDFTNQKIIAFATTALNVRVLTIQVGNCMTAVYNSGTGFVTWNRSASAAVCLL